MSDTFDVAKHNAQRLYLDSSEELHRLAWTLFLVREIEGEMQPINGEPMSKHYERCISELLEFTHE